MTAEPVVRPALTVADLQIALGVGERKVLELFAKGDLPAPFPEANQPRTVPAAAFDAWCAERGRLAAEQAHRRANDVQGRTTRSTGPAGGPALIRRPTG